MARAMHQGRELPASAAEELAHLRSLLERLLPQVSD